MTELTELVKPVSDPDLKPGDLVLIDGRPVTVQEIVFHAPQTHPDSGLPSHRPALKIVTRKGSQYFALALQMPTAT